MSVGSSVATYVISIQSIHVLCSEKYSSLQSDDDESMTVTTVTTSATPTTLTCESLTALIIHSSRRAALAQPNNIAQKSSACVQLPSILHLTSNTHVNLHPFARSTTTISNLDRNRSNSAHTQAPSTFPSLTKMSLSTLSLREQELLAIAFQYCLQNPDALKVRSFPLHIDPHCTHILQRSHTQGLYFDISAQIILPSCSLEKGKGCAHPLLTVPSHSPVFSSAHPPPQISHSYFHSHGSTNH